MSPQGPDDPGWSAGCPPGTSSPDATELSDGAFDPPRVDVLGVGISCVDLDSTVAIFDHWIGTDVRHYVCVTGMHGVMESRRDAELQAIHNRSGLTTPDGMPMVWAGRRAGGSIERVYGPDLMDAVFRAAVPAGWSSYFVGATTEVLEALSSRLLVDYPGIRIVGTESPPFRPLLDEEDAALVARINAAAPDLVWVGLGTPKQEHWMSSTAASSTPQSWSAWGPPSTCWPAPCGRPHAGCSEADSNGSIGSPSNRAAYGDAMS